MSKIRQHYDEDFRKNTVKLSYATSKTIKALAEDLGINPSLIYRWRKLYTEQGDKTKTAEQPLHTRFYNEPSFWRKHVEPLW